MSPRTKCATPQSKPRTAKTSSGITSANRLELAAWQHATSGVIHGSRSCYTISKKSAPTPIVIGVDSDLELLAKVHCSGDTPEWKTYLQSCRDRDEQREIAAYASELRAGSVLAAVKLHRLRRTDPSQQIEDAIASALNDAVTAGHLTKEKLQTMVAMELLTSKPNNRRYKAELAVTTEDLTEFILREIYPAEEHYEKIAEAADWPRVFADKWKSLSDPHYGLGYSAYRKVFNTPFHQLVEELEVIAECDNEMAALIASLDVEQLEHQADRALALYLQGVQREIILFSDYSDGALGLFAILFGTEVRGAQVFSLPDALAELMRIRGLDAKYHIIEPSA